LALGQFERWRQKFTRAPCHLWHGASPFKRPRAICPRRIPVLLRVGVSSVGKVEPPALTTAVGSTTKLDFAYSVESQAEEKRLQYAVNTTRLRRDRRRTVIIH